MLVVSWSTFACASCSTSSPPVHRDPSTQRPTFGSAVSLDRAQNLGDSFAPIETSRRPESNLLASASRAACMQPIRRRTSQRLNASTHLNGHGITGCRRLDPRISPSRVDLLASASRAVAESQLVNSLERALNRACPAPRTSTRPRLRCSTRRFSCPCHHPLSVLSAPRDLARGHSPARGRSIHGQAAGSRVEAKPPVAT